MINDSKEYMHFISFSYDIELYFYCTECYDNIFRSFILFVTDLDFVYFRNSDIFYLCEVINFEKLFFSIQFLPTHSFSLLPDLHTLRHLCIVLHVMYLQFL